MNPFLLGLSSGTVCLAYCSPVLVPYLLGEGRTVRRNAILVAQFLLGRLIGYLIFGILAWTIGLAFQERTAHREVFIGVIYMALAALMVMWGFSNKKSDCPVKSRHKLLGWVSGHFPVWIPFLFGFLTGLNLCPPFLLAFTGAATTGTILGSLSYFLMFFAGTSVYMLPMPLLGGFRRLQIIQTVGRLASGIIGFYFFYTGLIIFRGGLALL